jgi:hypothetical protein
LKPRIGRALQDAADPRAFSACPVIKAASWLERNTAAPAMSLGFAKRLIA